MALHGSDVIVIESSSEEEEEQVEGRAETAAPDSRDLERPAEAAPSDVEDPGYSPCDTGADLFAKFSIKCTPLVKKHPEAIDYLQLKWSKASLEYKSSVECRNRLRRSILKVVDHPRKVFVFIQEVCTTLKANTVKRNLPCSTMKDNQNAKLESANQTATSESTVESRKRLCFEDHDEATGGGVCEPQTSGNGEPLTGQPEGKRAKKTGSKQQIRNMEHLLQLYAKEIRKLQTKELDLDEMKNEDSTYIQEHKLKKKMMHIFDRLCTLKGCDNLTGRVIEKPLKFNSTRYPEINKRIQKLANNNVCFPDYQDVLSVVKRANEKSNLSLSIQAIRRLAEECFREVGGQLQERRHLDHMFNFGSHLTDLYKPGSDPALASRELARRLRSNRVQAVQRLEDVIRKYAIMQEDGMEQASKNKSQHCHTRDDSSSPGQAAKSTETMSSSTELIIRNKKSESAGELDIGGKEDEATARNEELDNTSTEQEKRCQHTGAKNDDEEEDKGLETETEETLNCKTDSENTNGGEVPVCDKKVLERDSLAKSETKQEVQFIEEKENEDFEQERIEITEEKENDDMEITEEKENDDVEQERIEITEEKENYDIEITEEKENYDIEITEEKENDDIEQERIEITEEKENDDIEQERIEITEEKENYDIEQERIEITEEKENDDIEQERIEITEEKENDTVDLEGVEAREEKEEEIPEFEVKPVDFDDDHHSSSLKDFESEHISEGEDTIKGGLKEHAQINAVQRIIDFQGPEKNADGGSPSNEKEEHPSHTENGLKDREEQDDYKSLKIDKESGGTTFKIEDVEVVTKDCAGKQAGMEATNNKDKIIDEMTVEEMVIEVNDEDLLIEEVPMEIDHKVFPGRCIIQGGVYAEVVEGISKDAGAQNGVLASGRVDRRWKPWHEVNREMNHGYQSFQFRRNQNLASGVEESRISNDNCKPFIRYGESQRHPIASKVNVTSNAFRRQFSDVLRHVKVEEVKSFSETPQPSPINRGARTSSWLQMQSKRVSSIKPIVPSTKVSVCTQYDPQEIIVLSDSD